jgi:hypothetical protein
LNIPQWFLFAKHIHGSYLIAILQTQSYETSAFWNYREVIGASSKPLDNKAMPCFFSMQLTMAPFDATQGLPTTRVNKRIIGVAKSADAKLNRTGSNFGRQ